MSDLTARCRQVLEAVADRDIRDLAAGYPQERTLTLSWQDLAEFEQDSLEQTKLEGERVQEDEHGLEDVRGIASDVVARPEDTIEAFDDALRSYDVDGVRTLARASVEIVDLPEGVTYPVGGFRPDEHIERLIALEGQITKRTEVNPKLTTAAFECFRCGELIRLPQPVYGSIREPHECPNLCDKPFFRRIDDKCEWTAYQKIRLQQPPEEAKGESENIDVHLIGDLAGNPSVEGGARTTFTGRLTPDYTGDVVFEKSIVGHGFTVEEGGLEDVDLDEYAGVIDDLANDPNRFERLVASFAPGHEGNWVEKAALVLQMFGGWRRTAPDGTAHRGDSHIYLLGDPGTGKTNLLEAAYERAPRAAITDGTGSSAAGLTAALAKDDFGSGEWTIEAGTLVRANKGVAIVDELDKGDTSDLDALHTALESQEVRVSKAGKNATLPARTALLAAGNPTGGHFDPTETFAEQVDLQSPLLSRFGLILTMRSEEDKEVVRDIANRIVRARTVAGKLDRGDDVDDSALEDVTADIEPQELAAYVTRAKQEQPVPASEQVEQRMVEWYTQTKTSLPERYSSRMGEGEYDGPPLPITARKLDALQRLAEASARMRLSSEVTLADVERVIPLVERSLADIGIAPRDNTAFGEVDEDVDAANVGV